MASRCPAKACFTQHFYKNYDVPRKFSKIAVLGSHRPGPGFRRKLFVLGRPMKILKNGILGRSRPCPIGNGPGRHV